MTHNMRSTELPRGLLHTTMSLCRRTAKTSHVSEDQSQTQDHAYPPTACAEEVPTEAEVRVPPKGAGIRSVAAGVGLKRHIDKIYLYLT